MKVNLGATGIAYPMPVFILGTYNENGTPNAMTAAWGAIVDYKKIGIVIDKNHKTIANIKKTKAFTVSFATQEQVAECDFVGLVSANDDENKLQKTKWTFEKSQFVNAPVFDQLPLALECELENFDEKTELCTGKIINLVADDSILTNGTIDLSKFHPITYDSMNHNYISLGQKVAKAFEVGKTLK